MEKKMEYNEIKELYKYCVKIGINAVLETLCDGYAIRFPDGGDFVQHQYSYGGDLGYVEPAIGKQSGLFSSIFEKRKDPRETS